jgi:hypothetical protein
MKTRPSRGAARLLVAAGALLAAPAPWAAPAAPADAGAQATRVPYESSFKDYRPFREQPVASWKEANDLVHRLGGWKAYAADRVPERAPEAGPPEASKAAVPEAKVAR